MSGDFTRNSFRPEKAYSAVRMQQGRLFTDADWNEEGDIGRDSLRRTATSVIGASGFPEDNAGFEIIAAPAAGGLVVGAGEAYLDGIRIMLPAAETLTLKRHSGAGASTKWQVDKGARVAAGDVIVLQGQAIAQGVRVVAPLLPDNDGKQIFQCGAALSVNDNIQVRRYRSVDSQPFLPGPVLPTQAADYLAYLDVWERPIGAVEDPAIREVAFGGPDTAMRDQVVWQVKFAKIADLVAAGALTLPASCESFGPGWTPFGPQPQRGTMAAKAEAAGVADNPCVLPSTGGYRSLENHLYRVEVHNGGPAALGKVTIKWSRDNGIHRTAYREVDNLVLVVDSVGRDDAALKTGDWIEVLDERALLGGKPGHFAKIAAVDGNRVAIDELRAPDSPGTAIAFANLDMLPRPGLIRRWEGGPPVAIAADSWIALERGVSVLFGGGRYSTQDHWTIPARTISASIEWPRDPVADGPALLPPAGIAHHYCALALATLAPGGWTISSDCRSLFAPLTRLRGFHYLGGDGQEAMPNPLAPANRISLAADLRAGFVRGRKPVAGANVRFTVTIGDGRLPNGTKVQIVPTDADGVAKLKWSVDAATQSQQVLAELLDGAGQRSQLPILYTASLSRASATAFDPANTPSLAGENNVQGAIEKLAGFQQIGCSTRVVVEGSDWVSVLKGLQPGENATICFQRGTFATQETVKLANLGHITLSGAGGGTMIVGKRRECAIEFTNCASVTIHGLDVSTPDGTGAIQEFTRRQGTLSMIGCGAVDVCDSSLSCGAGVASERTCLTVRGKDMGSEASVPTPSVRVLRNRLTVGYAQDGILITDCTNAIVEENEIGISSRPLSMTVPKLLENKAWRARLVALLVVNPASEGFATGEDVKEIRFGDWVASFDSTVPQEQWSALVDAHPPTQAQQKTPAAYGLYVESLVDIALTPNQMPLAHKKRMTSLAKRAGAGTVDALPKEVKRGMLLSTEPDVQRFDERMGRAGDIVIAAQGFRIIYGSPIAQAGWNQAMKMMEPGQLQRAGDLIAHVESIAQRFIVDPQFRDQIASARSWYQNLVTNLPSFARQAIICGGWRLGEVAILRNRIDGFVEGVHVSTSEARLNKNEARKLMARNVAIEGNTMFLRMPVQGGYVPCGLFVGNAETVRIHRNRLDWATPRTSGNGVFTHGIRVHGYLGEFLAISENRVRVGSTGIKVQPVEPPDDSKWSSYLWFAADNLAEGCLPDNVVKGPQFLERRNNRPQ
ncbi:MAG TPA: DUF6519 domain-containing protein [Allosphingosinicella sp.]|nr:DUF6519 domain-containing protein [Allosphingosinicella sp.]